MLWLKLTVTNGAPAALETYRNDIDTLRGFPISEDPFDQHFADLVPNLVQAALLRIAAAQTANEEPAQADVDLVTQPGAPPPAYAINIADEWPLASDETQVLTPSQMQHLVAFPANASTFDFDTHDPEWTVQTVGP